MAPATADSEKLQGLGALIGTDRIAFRVWAPHATQVSVIGTFNDWNPATHPLQAEEDGKWYAEVAEAKVGDEYRFLIRNGEQEFSRIDPYARDVTNSVGNGIISNGEFDWGDDQFQIAPLNELVVYEMHIGTFGQSKHDDEPSGFDQAIRKLNHLQTLGINCVEIMPAAEFAGDYSWGYNPAHIFAVESAYGGPEAFKRFVREAHRRGIAVVLDVVYNHFGPSDLSLWQFDGWSENDLGGIYFYNDWRADTPWGKTRPDYGRGEVRSYIYDNVMMWLRDFHVDGLRFDMTLYIRHVAGDGDPGKALPDGWSLAQWINQSIRKEFPGRITIAEDLQNNDGLTQSSENGGAGFSTQWDARFVHPIRAILTEIADENRSLEVVREALQANYNGDPYQRVVYTESHDEVANGKARIPSEVMPDDPENWFAMKRATLGGALVLTAPGVPMLFQGQEFLEDGYFQDTVPVDWHKANDFRGVVRLFRDLIQLRRNVDGHSRGLIASNLGIIHEDQAAHILAWHRWFDHGPGDDVVVIANFCREPRTASIHFPAAGEWQLRLNSDATIYHPLFGDTPAADVSIGQPGDVCDVTVGPYAVLVYSLGT
ncbi:alpha-amylase family glycosyl hydrolase [Planctomicrobium sp. SH664]|uniref:alpha-amylase family glycosyl hydrolase n=1 Tax=Planctomicrobium sp. SH664 TaxID=3448125 RepID=UPI003F5B1BA1